MENIMEIGNKIKQLRYQSKLTQEQLATKVGVSPQSVSKWETGLTLPDISMLPILAEVFGVTIDEIFDLATEQKLKRLENRIDVDGEFTADEFREYESMLKSQLAENKNKGYIVGLLAELYHHRMESDSKKVSRYAREAIMLNPNKKGCQWLLEKAEKHAGWDWNFTNHTKAIDFYKEVIESSGDTTAMPYFYLMDNLLADHRTAEAKDCLVKIKALVGTNHALIPTYEAHIALCEFDETKADAIIEKAVEQFGDDSGHLFEAAQYYARKCDYEKAIELYERSWAAEEDEKPRFWDALQGIATINKILGRTNEAEKTYDRILDCLKNEWGYSEDDKVYLEVSLEKMQ
jgi:transcriptional regulator with XRE-family HTH domain